MKRHGSPTATPPPVLGEGCLARYDPAALSDEDGADFDGAAALWQSLNPPGDASVPTADGPPGTETPDHPPVGRSGR